MQLLYLPIFRSHISHYLLLVKRFCSGRKKKPTQTNLENMSDIVIFFEFIVIWEGYKTVIAKDILIN